MEPLLTLRELRAKFDTNIESVNERLIMQHLAALSLDNGWLTPATTWWKGREIMNYVCKVTKDKLTDPAWLSENIPTVLVVLPRYASVAKWTTTLLINMAIFDSIRTVCLAAYRDEVAAAPDEPPPVSVAAAKMAADVLGPAPEVPKEVATLPPPPSVQKPVPVQMPRPPAVRNAGDVVLEGFEPTDPGPDAVRIDLPDFNQPETATGEPLKKIVEKFQAKRAAQKAKADTTKLDLKV